VIIFAGWDRWGLVLGLGLGFVACGGGKRLVGIILWQCIGMFQVRVCDWLEEDDGQGVLGIA